MTFRFRRKWSTPILHADLDAFYASVEVLRDPTLEGKPVIVGGTSNRGVVTSASYEARAYGVRSAMPTARARRLCPDGIFIQPDFEAYTEKSKEVRAVFDEFSPTVEPLSLDEAFLDISGAGRLWGEPEDLGSALREEVREGTGLRVSVGLAPNKFLAKLASVRAKPDGLMVVEPSEVNSFLYPLRLEHLWGVGVETAQMLTRLGLRTVGDVASIPRATLERALGPLQGGQVARLARGEDDRAVTADARRKSVGAEETFEHDLTDQKSWSQAILTLADRVSSRLRADGISGRTITLKVRFSSFTTITRSQTLAHEFDGAMVIYRVALALLSRALGGAEPGRKRVRLLGISVTHLRNWPPSVQLSLEDPPGWEDAEVALDSVRRRFGRQALKFGTLLEDD